MLRLIGINKNIENILSLSRSYLKGKEVSFPILKSAYKDFLRHVQPNVPKGSQNTVEFLKDFSESTQLISIFGEKSRLDDFDSVFSEDSDFQFEGILKAENCYKSLEKRYPILFYLFSLVINIVFSGPSEKAGGGSTSGAVGCIWVNPRPTWLEQDFIEFFVHEMTHNLIFLDEYRYHHYTDYRVMLLEENYAMSAILSKKRPLDKVFHSILVSTEVLLARCAVLGHPESPKLHPPTSIMLEKTVASIDSLQSSHVYSILTDRAKDLISLCEDHLQKMQLLDKSEKHLTACAAPQ